MQSLSWYRHRLTAMSPGEVCWRLRGKLQQTLDRRRVHAGRGVPTMSDVWEAGSIEAGLRPAMFGPGWPSRADAEAQGEPGRAWCERLLGRAERILAGRITLFDLVDHDLGPRVDWNYEYKARRSAPLHFAADVDYRDYREVGDCKFAWEPSRFTHAVVLGRAYRWSGDVRFARCVVEHILSWIEQCPFGRGMQWRSGLELAIRLINWTWAIELIRPSGLLNEAFWARVLPIVHLHLWEIDRKYSAYSSANNHLVGEAAGVYLAAGYFGGLKHAAAWRERARQVLLGQIDAQHYADGANREQATGYHLFVLEFLLLAGLAGRNLGEPYPDDWWSRCEQVFEFVAALSEGGDCLPMLGDCDDGFVLDLGEQAMTPRELLAVGAAVFGRGDFKRLAGGPAEPVGWLLGAAGWQRYQALEDNNASNWLVSRAFADAGLFLLQSGTVGGADAISVLFDCGELGFGSIAAHGHADALSLVLRVAGRDVLVDPGTYDYFTYREWRDYFRSTAAHNTIAVDDQDQSQRLGLFLWGRRARARCLRWQPDEQGGEVVGEHDGYRFLPGKVIHRRTVRLDRVGREVWIQDELSGAGSHEAAIRFHFAEKCRVASVGSGTAVEWAFDIPPMPGKTDDESGPAGRLGPGHSDTQLYGRVVGNVRGRMILDPCWQVQALQGSEAPPAGWVSRSYHRRHPTVTLVGRCGWVDRLVTTTQISLADAESSPR